MSPELETSAFTLLALLAFAANSLLTRLALARHALDAATFTAIRLSAGALVLALIVRWQARTWQPLKRRDLAGPIALLGYAAAFSFAYLRIGAAVGALVLFGVVQLTMIGWGIARGERPTASAWLGLVLAGGGLLALLLPSAARPDLTGVLLMVIAGVAWAVYSLLGKRAPDALAANAHSFLWSSPAAWLLVASTRHGQQVTGGGVALAIASGAVTSGIGYAIWYRALRKLRVTQAAVAQLSVPVIAALGAGLLLGEHLGSRFVLCACAVLGGVFLVLFSRNRARPS